MTNAIDFHFSLHEKIEKYRPKRNGDGDIEKCISVCEMGMDNLPGFIRECHIEYKDHSVIIPPSIPCRDVLLKCYLIISDFEKARSVVNRSVECRAWDERRGNDELEFINNVESAYISVQSRVREYPGTLQKDLYVILPELDRNALKWYLANTNSLIKRKIKSTYSLWLEGQDIPEEPIQEIADNNHDVVMNEGVLILAKKDINLSLFPKWYVSISFGYSTSKNYQKAVTLAKSAPQYIESFDEDNNIIHQAVFSEQPSDYLAFISLYELINNWKSCFVIINGEIADRKIVGGINYCYGDKLRSGKSDFCYGASEYTINPFGCHRLQISQFNNPWWKFGRFDTNGVWYVNKNEILDRIKEYSTPYIHCPAFSMERVLKALDDLPDFINPEIDKDWVRVNEGVEPKNHLAHVNSITITVDVNKQLETRRKKEGFLSSLLKLTGLRK